MGVPLLAPIDGRAIATPATPGSGYGRLFYNTASKHWCSVDDAGILTDLAASSAPGFSNYEATLSGGPMVPVQQKDTVSAATASLAATIDNLPKVGNTLMVLTGNTTGSTAIASGQGGATTWTLAKTNAGGSYDSDCWIGVVDGTPSQTVTITLTSGRISAKVLEWPGVLTVDQAATAFATNTIIDPGSVTPTTPRQLVVSLGVAFQPISSGPTGGFTDLGTIVNASFTCGCAYQVQGAAAAADATWTIPSNAWVGVIASFKTAVTVPPARAGQFDITGLSGLTAGKPVFISKAAGPYTGKGNLADEAEMDMIVATGYVVDATTIRVYWQADTPQVGKVKFNYLIGA